MASGKRVAEPAALPPGKVAHAPASEGVTYLFYELRKINRTSKVLVEHDDNDFCTWTLYMTPDVLTSHDYAEICPYLKQWSKQSKQDPVIVLRITFPKRFPNDVPFVRIVRPRFQYQTGHVTIGGSICTPLLTASNWKPMNVDSLVASIIVILKEGGARIQLKPDYHCNHHLMDYTEEEAREAYARVVARYGW